MRIALISAIAMLLLAADARADAWLPADPGRDERAAITAADGTAVAVAGSAQGSLELFVRPPGGAYREAHTVAEALEQFDVAVAPGGWVAAVWKELDAELRLTIIRPDGSTHGQVLDPDRSASEPAVAIDARGTVTAAWMSLDGARTLSGATLPDAQHVDVAMSPNGRRLLAWSTYDGVLARIDDEPERPFPPATLPDGVTAAINDAGAAAVAYESRGLQMVDRAAGGEWVPSHPVTGTYRVAGPQSLAAEEEPLVSLAVAADGRAVVTWISPSPFTRRRLVGAAGQVGGAWGPPTPLSSPLIGTYASRIGYDAAGTPWVTWAEGGWNVRGAKPVVGATPDTTPLGATLRILPRALTTRDGHLTLTATAGCAKPCDVWLHEGSGGLSINRTLTAGRTKRLRMRFRELTLLYPGRPTRSKVSLAVADRAGHVQRITRTYRVRVVRRPLQSFRVGPSHSFAMAQRAGDRAVGRLVNELLNGLADRSIRSERALQRRYVSGMRALERAGYEEVLDTATVDEIYEAVAVPFALAGYHAGAVLSF